MTNYSQTPAMNRIRDQVEFTRKACGFDEVHATVTPDQVYAILGDEKLPVFKASDLWREGNAYPIHDWDTPPTDNPIVFILKLDDDHTYLVNTEGYTYCRYIARFMEPASPATFEQ